jgi:hypothetical protein
MIEDSLGAMLNDQKDKKWNGGAAALTVERVSGACRRGVHGSYPRTTKSTLVHAARLFEAIGGF